jgi:hypothetical protein
MKIINSYILVILFLLFSVASNAQINFKLYLNDSIRFDLILSRIHGDERNNFSELILKTNVDEGIKKSFFKLPNQQLLAFLNDTATAWATNLLLYEKYREDPTVYCNAVKDKRDWNREILIKKADIVYWTKFLKRKHK